MIALAGFLAIAIAGIGILVSQVVQVERNQRVATAEDAGNAKDFETRQTLHEIGMLIADAVGKVVTNRGGTARTLVDAAIASKAGAL